MLKQRQEKSKESELSLGNSPDHDLPSGAEPQLTYRRRSLYFYICGHYFIFKSINLFMTKMSH